MVNIMYKLRKFLMKSFDLVKGELVSFLIMGIVNDLKCKIDYCFNVLMVVIVNN